MKQNDTNQATPRPWKFDQANNGVIAFRIAGNGFILAGVYFKNTSEYAVSRDEAAANVALIVQAVNLFEAHEAVASAAEGVQWAETLLLKHVKGPADHEIYLRNKREAHKAMDAALSALKAKKGEV